MTTDNKEYRLAYYQKNKAKIRKYQREWRKRNKEKMTAYYGDRKEQHAEYYKQYREDNKEKLREYMREYMTNYRKTRKGKAAIRKAQMRRLWKKENGTECTD